MTSSSPSRIAAELIPPAVVKLARRLKAMCLPNSSLHFSRPHPSFVSARAASNGYDSEAIADVVAATLGGVKEGRFAFERDGQGFDRIIYAWPLLAGLLWVAAREGRLRVCDFGGSLGSAYFQNRAFLTDLDVEYSVVEQRPFVERGRRLFQDERLNFYDTAQAAMEDRPSDVLLLSGVLPYLEDPYRTATELFNLDYRYVLIDRTPLLEAERDLITVQTVPTSVYRASYPAWFLSRAKFTSFLAERFQIIAEFESFERWDLGYAEAQSYGFILERRPR